MATILFVDDEEDTVFVFSMLLSARGYQVEPAADGEEALRNLALSRPDVIVTDWMMPGMGGEELCATLRAQGSPFAAIPIIAASATDLALEGDRELCDRVLRKPYSAEELVREIEALAG